VLLLLRSSEPIKSAAATAAGGLALAASTCGPIVEALAPASGGFVFAIAAWREFGVGFH
jgi:hypothetical protein